MRRFLHVTINEFREAKIQEHDVKVNADQRVQVLEKKLSMEEKKFRTLQDEFREVNKKYQVNKSELVEQTELNIKLDGKVKLLQEDVDRQIEEATGKLTNTARVLHLPIHYCHQRPMVDCFTLVQRGGSAMAHGPWVKIKMGQKIK